MSLFYTILTGIGFLLIPFGLYQISNKQSPEYYQKYKKGIYISGVGFILFFLGLIKVTQPDFSVGFTLIFFSSITAIYFNPYFFSKRMKQKREELYAKSLSQNLSEEEQRSHDYFNSERHWYELSKKTIKIGLIILLIEFVWKQI
jgi:hypothetical protein